MKRRIGWRRVITAAVMGAALLPGCSHITMLRTAELREVRQQVDSLHNEISVLQKALAEEQKRQGDLMRSLRADQSTRFSELERNISSLINHISESQDRLTKIDQKTEAIKEHWDERRLQDSISRSMRSAESDALYSTAQQDYTAGQFEKAITGFQQFCATFPTAPQIEDASYYIGEGYYNLKRYADAETNLLGYIKLYPAGRQICAALYKLGLSYEALKKSKSQDVVWNKLTTQCPDSDEARAVMARTRGR